MLWQSYTYLIIIIDRGQLSMRKKVAYTGLQEVPKWIINLIMENWRGVEQLANKLFLTGIFNLRDIKSTEVEREDGLNNL